MMHLTAHRQHNNLQESSAQEQKNQKCLDIKLEFKFFSDNQKDKDQEWARNLYGTQNLIIGHLILSIIKVYGVQQWFLEYILSDLHLYTQFIDIDLIIHLIYYLMNYIQKAWLTALKPLATLVNDKLAKKSGLLGRIGRFYAFGPRQFGYHPTSKYLALLNHSLVSSIGLMLHKYSFVKSLTMNGHTYMRNYRIIMLLGYGAVFGAAYLLISPSHSELQDGTSLAYLKDRLPATPINALNNRTSAHYTEINDLYMHEMTKNLIQKFKQIEQNRRQQSDEVKKTKYARPGYQYVAAHSNVKPSHE